MTYLCLKIGDARRKPVVRDLEAWIKQADKLYKRFNSEIECSPFDYHEVASVGFLASASALAGFLPMNEYDVIKRGRMDKRRAVKGRADLWFDTGENCYSFEFKRARRPITANYLEDRLTRAHDDVECVRDDEFHYAAGCVIALAREPAREQTCVEFAQHDSVDYAYRIGDAGERAFLFFRLRLK